MTKAEIVQWLATEFTPLTLAVPSALLTQIVGNAYRYWNTHSAYRIEEMVNAEDSTPAGAVELPKHYKDVVKVYPATDNQWIFSSHPLWTLLGIQVLDNVTSDLVMIGQSFQNYRYYVGMDFNWKFVKSESPESVGRLFFTNAPTGVTKFCVVGTKRVIEDDDTTQEYLLDWLLYYSKALVKIAEGNILRKSAIVGVKNDGQELLNEGKEEKKELEERLTKDGRWIAQISRF